MAIIMKSVKFTCKFAMCLLCLLTAACADGNSVSTSPTQVGRDSSVSTLPLPENHQENRQPLAESRRSEDAARNAIESQTPISVPGKPNGTLKTGMDYADLRRAVLAKGWMPVVDRQCKVNVDGGNELCDQMPELSDCSADGYCLMHFHLASTNQDMEVGTYGDTTGRDVRAKDSQLVVTGLTVAVTTTH